MALVLRQLLAIVPEKEKLVNRKNQYGWAPLHILCSGGREQQARAGMFAQLCQAKADVEVTKKRDDATHGGCGDKPVCPGRGPHGERRGPEQLRR